MTRRRIEIQGGMFEFYPDEKLSKETVDAVLDFARGVRKWPTGMISVVGEGFPARINMFPVTTTTTTAMPLMQAVTFPPPPPISDHEPHDRPLPWWKRLGKR